MDRSATIEQLVQAYTATSKLLKSQFHQSFTDAAVAPSQLQLLFMTEEMQPVALKLLSQKMYMTPGAVTQLVDPLVEAGYISREQSAHDRRSTCISLTDKGFAKLATLRAAHRKLFTDIMQDMSDDDLQSMLRLQRKLLDALESRTE